jgi:hypothetical protein
MKFLTQTQHFMQVDRIDVERILSSENIFSASQSGKYSVTLHFRSREVRFPVQCQKFLVECGKKSSGVREKCADTVDLFFSQLL